LLRLTLIHHEPLSNFAFISNLRRYGMLGRAGVHCTAGSDSRSSTIQLNLNRFRH
jgi:hypothetical protein